jgi:hypothetical protein
MIRGNVATVITGHISVHSVLPLERHLLDKSRARYDVCGKDRAALGTL